MKPFYLPKGFERSVPEWFATQLRGLDPNLIVYFNRMRGLWVIDRCTRGGAMNAAAHVHGPQCKTTNVLVVQDNGRYMPLCDAVLDDLRSMDSWKHGSLENFEKHHDNIAHEDEVKRDAAIDAVFREASIDNRRQLLKAYDLTQIHDVHRINQ